MTVFRVGDIPAGLGVFDIPAYVPVAGYNTAVGVLTGPDGVTVPLVGASFTIGSTVDDRIPDPDADDIEPVVTVDWGTVSPFADPGLYSLTVTLTKAGVQQTLPAYPIVVDVEDGWHTLDSIRSGWPDAPKDDADCYELLTIAKQAVTAYAPALPVDAVVPVNYRRGQQMQARNVWNASKVDPGNGSLGDDSFTIRPFPLDWSVKQVLRPKPGIPPVG